MKDPETDQRTDEILGITRCAECGHRLDGEVDCPFCSAVRGMDGPVDTRPSQGPPIWIYLTAMLLTFPLSLPWIVMSRRLNLGMKAATLSAGVLWASAFIWFL